MSNKNFGEPWEGKIERIRENLREGRYEKTDGIFPIVKELVQNAEDANAGQLMIAWSGGLPNADHPLLRAPALLAINDGVFDAENARAIREMGLSSKTADSASIGKFGLGMKSVFHLSEVFFFVAFDENGKQFDADLRNPWSSDEDGLHPKWDDFGKADIERVASQVHSLALNSRWNSFAKSKRWFCLWLPLRRQVDLNDIDPIEPYFPGEKPADDLLGAGQALRLSTLLPMLSHLKRVEFKIGGAPDGTQLEVRVDGGSTRRASLTEFNEFAAQESLPFSGTVTAESGSTKSLATFSGVELRPIDERLSVLSQNEKWPKRFATDKATGKSKQVPEKAHAHSAVCFSASRCSGGEPRLHINWSVFLPLGSPEVCPLRSCDWEIDIFLHGWFFPNSGRTDVEGLSGECPDLNCIEDSSSVRRAWNHCLAGGGTLPLIPTAFAQFVEHSQWEPNVIHSVTEAIQASGLFRRFQSEICRDANWFHRLISGIRRQWQAVPASADYFELPRIDNATEPLLLSKAFPALSKQLEMRVVVIRVETRLAAREPSRWPNDAVRELLQTADPTAIFESPAMLTWFTDLLDKCAERVVWKQLRLELAGLARDGLPAVVANGSQALISATKTFLSRIPEPLRVSLPIKIGDDDIARDLFSLVCQQSVDVVWVPNDCVPDTTPGSGTVSGTVSAKQAGLVLRALAKWGERQMSSSARETLGEFAAHISRAVADSMELLRIAGELKLFSGTDCRKQEERQLSWNDIVEHQRAHALFAKPSPMARQLQDALSQESILLISANLARLLFGNDHEVTKQCREAQLLAAISATRRPRLTEPAKRKKLLETLLGYAGGRDMPGFNDGVRFVLHGKSDRYGMSDRLLVRRSDTADIWRRTTNIALKTLGQEWRILDPAFSGILSDERRPEFGVDLIGPTAAIALAQELINSRGNSADFSSLCPTDDEYKELLRYLDNRELCRCLPIHKDRVGNSVAIDDRTFWESDLTVPEELAEEIRLLKLSDDESTRKRQLQLADPLDAIRLIEIVLQQPTPSAFWNVVLDALSRTSDSSPSDLAAKLRSTTWIPTTAATFIKPDDVIHLPTLRECVTRLIADHPGVYFDPELFALEVREHPARNFILEHLVPNPDRALEMLGVLLQKDNRNRVGVIDMSMEDWLDSFRAADTCLFPQIELLRTVSTEFPSAASHTFRELQQPIEDERTRDLLSFLRREHERERSKSRQEKLLGAYGKYLTTILSRETFHERLRDMQLPARDGSWRSAKDLCFDNDGVAQQAIVASSIAATLADLVPDDRDVTASPVSPNRQMVPIAQYATWDFTAAAERLRGYFDSWRDIVPNEQIGGFLSLLGDEPSLRRLAQQYLGRNRTIEATREKFGLLEMPAGGRIEDGPTMISKQRVVVEIVDHPNVRSLNLVGEWVELPRNKRPSTLFVGFGNPANPFPHKVINGLRVRCFRLNVISPGNFSETELSRLLRDSAIKFIGEAYNSYENQTNFANTWDRDLKESDQLDIRITQSRIVEHGFLILDQYGLRSDPQLAKVLDQWDTAERLKAERETQSQPAGRHSHLNPERELQAAHRELRNVLEQKEPNVSQQRVLEAVRHRIADYYQYKRESIPFELFQNADDAYAELRDYFQPAGRQHPHHDVPTVILWRNGNRIALAHFGRRINQYPVGADQASRGFDNDLWKMSVLSLSNKGHAGDSSPTTVTGKFGLGFKSVFLACDRPRLLSGRLAFEFVGGVYPRRLIGEERHSLDEIRRSQASDDLAATIIEMELNEGITPESVIDRFVRLAHLLVVFGRQVRCFRLCQEGKKDETRWECPTDLPHNPGLQTGTIRSLPSATTNSSSSNVLLFKSDAGSLLFRLGSRTFDRFPHEVPPVWVTAPTEEPLDLGFLINGPFSLDVGRAQLARDPQQNEKAACRLGKRFGEQLEQLFESSQSPRSWIEVRQSLQLAADAIPFELWESLWKLLVTGVAKETSRDEPAVRLVLDILWNTPDQGAAGFYARKKAVPTGLPGSHFERELIALAKVRYSVCGMLAQDDGYALACVRKWPKFQERIADGQLVSDEKIVAPLRAPEPSDRNLEVPSSADQAGERSDRNLCPQLVKGIKPIDIADVLSWELPHQMVSDEDANRFGELINKQLVAKLKDPAEQNRLKDVLRPIQFLASDDRYYAASRLLIGHQPAGTPEGKYRDERRRAAFAPKDRVLNSKYGATGVEFFVACRKEKLDASASARDMAVWIKKATEPALQKAALDYLATGELGRTVQQELKQIGMEERWLANLSNHPVFQGMASGDKGRLLDLLPQAIAQTIVNDEIKKRQEVQPLWPKRPPERILADISAWWRNENGKALLNACKHRLFLFDPDQHGPLLAEYNCDDKKQRKAWMRLFMLGMSHTMGRTSSGQDLGFVLDFCDSKGWLDEFVDPSGGPERWARILHDYLEPLIEESKYLHWMRQFVGIYAIAENLDVYVASFLNIDKLPIDGVTRFPLKDITCPRRSRNAPGDAPPVARSLGMGACFIVRELLRLKVIENRYAWEHAFVPKGAVRRLLQTIGCSFTQELEGSWMWSPEIWRFITTQLGTDAATFELGFDLPFQVLAHKDNAAKRRELFDIDF